MQNAARHFHIRIANAADAPHPIRLCGKRQAFLLRIIRAAERADGLDQRVHAHIIQRAARQNRIKRAGRKRAPRARKIVRFRRGFIQMLFQKDFVALGQRLAHVARHQHAVTGKQPAHLRRDAQNIRALSVRLIQKDDRRYFSLLQQLEERRRVALHAFRTGDDQQRRIQHGKRALHLAGKIDVPRRIHQRDEQRLVPRNGPRQRRLLGKNRDAARAFHRVIVHECVAVIDASARANHARVPKQLFAERRLARIDMRRNPQRQIHSCSSACPSCAFSSSSRMRSNTASTTFC